LFLWQPVIERVKGCLAMIFGQKKKAKSKKHIWYKNSKEANNDKNSHNLEHRRDSRVDYIFFKPGDPRVKLNKLSQDD